MNVYETISEIVIKSLEKGAKPWVKPWFGTAGAYNRVTKKTYSLLNQILLGRPGEYATFKQWQALGGKIRRGEKSSFVVFWKLLEKEPEEDTEGKKQVIPILRYYRVFHVEQVEGVESLAESATKTDLHPIKEAESLLQSYLTREKIGLVNGENASYSPVLDRIMIPRLEQFISSEEFYLSAFHEAVHSTGHKSRLDRSLVSFSDNQKSYAAEELVAEMGAYAIMHKLGIETKDSSENSVAYLHDWAELIKADNHLVVNAASKAEKAVNFIM